MKVLQNDHLNAHGFTLIEIIIVLSLMVMVLGLSTVYYANSLPKFRLNEATREIMAEIRKARALSRIQNEQQTIVFRLDKKTFGIDGGKMKEIPEGISIRITHPLTGEISREAQSITFHPTGGAEGFTIILSNKTRSQIIKIDPVVGAAVVQ